MGVEHLGRNLKILDFGVVDGYDVGAAALHFKREEPVPGADVERALAGERIGDGEFTQPVVELLQRDDAFQHTPVFERDGMNTEAFARQVFDQQLIEGGARRIFGANLRHSFHRLAEAGENTLR